MEGKSGFKKIISVFFSWMNFLINFTDFSFFCSVYWNKTSWILDMGKQVEVKLNLP